MYVVSLDVNKASGSVSHYYVTMSVQVALVVLAIEERRLPIGLKHCISRLIVTVIFEAIFEVCSVCSKSEPVEINREVRQRKPLSPFLFCFTECWIECLGSTPCIIDFGMGTLVNSLTFVDVILISVIKWGLKILLGLVEDAARNQGLVFNDKKCCRLFRQANRRNLKSSRPPLFNCGIELSYNCRQPPIGGSGSQLPTTETPQFASP